MLPDGQPHPLRTEAQLHIYEDLEIEADPPRCLTFSVSKILSVWILTHPVRPTPLISAVSEWITVSGSAESISTYNRRPPLVTQRINLGLKQISRQDTWLSHHDVDLRRRHLQQASHGISRPPLIPGRLPRSRSAGLGTWLAFG